MPGQEKVRVLIVDDNAETRDNIRRMLQFDTSIDVIGTAQSGREAISMAMQEKPDVVLMDINMPDMDGITATETIRRAAPFIQVIILSVQNDSSYMRKAMLAGARDYLNKPPTIEELTSAIRRAGDMAHDERAKASQSMQGTASGGFKTGGALSGKLGKIVVVYSPKGGTGCTTIAVNLAVALKSEEAKVLLVDANMQFGDIPVFLNEQVKNTLLDLTPIVDELDPEVVEDVLITHPTSGIQVLAAPNRPEIADTATGEQLGKLFEYLRRMFAYIVIDTSSHLTEAVQVALDASDLIVLLTTQDIPSIKNANLFLCLADSSGIPRDRILFVMNRYDKRIAISPERVGESLHQEIVMTIPFEEKVISNSVNRGIPFVYENKTQPISKTISTLAELIQERVAKLDEPRLDAIVRK